MNITFANDSLDTYVRILNELRGLIVEVVLDGGQHFTGELAEVHKGWLVTYEWDDEDGSVDIHRWRETPLVDVNRVIVQ